MKRFLSKFGLLTASMLVGLSASAYDFEVGGIYYNKNSDGSTVEVTFKDDITYNSYSGSVVIPGKVTFENIDYTVTSIGDYAFNRCLYSLTSVEIPNSVTSIGCYAFNNCNAIVSIEIPNSVILIDNGAFNNCDGLTSVHISDIAKWCEINFKDDSSNPLYYAHNLYLNGELVTNLVIPEGVTIVGDYAFHGCTSLTSVVIPSSVTSIGDYAFWYCAGLATVDMPNGVISIGSGAFNSCESLVSVTIPNSVTSIGGGVFGYCENLKHVEIPNGVSVLPFMAFYGSGLESIVIPNSVTSIEDDAFAYCYKMTSVTIGENVEKIGDKAFYNCLALNEINSLNPVPPVINSMTFSSYSCELNVPLGCKTKYEEAEYWKEFYNIKEKDFSDLGGVGQLEAENNAVEVARYTIDGRMIDEPQRGVNIVRYSDGSVRKVVAK